MPKESGSMLPLPSRSTPTLVYLRSSRIVSLENIAAVNVATATSDFDAFEFFMAGMLAI